MTTSIGGGEGWVAEDGVGAADVAYGAEVGEGEAVEVLGFVADGAELEAAVAEGEAAAVPVVVGLNTGVLKLAEDEVISAVGGEVEAGPALLADGDEGLQLLALDGGGGAAAFVDCVEQSVAETDGGAAESVAGVEIVRVELSQLGVVVEVPLDAQVVNRLKAHARGNGGEVAGRSEEGDGAHVECGVKDVAAAGDERSAEGGIDEERRRAWGCAGSCRDAG